MYSVRGNDFIGLDHSTSQFTAFYLVILSNWSNTSCAVSEICGWEMWGKKQFIKTKCQGNIGCIHRLMKLEEMWDISYPRKLQVPWELRAFIHPLLHQVKHSEQTCAELYYMGCFTLSLQNFRWYSNKAHSSIVRYNKI